MGFELACFDFGGGERRAVILFLADERDEWSSESNVKILNVFELFIINLFNYDLALIYPTYMKRNTNIRGVS